MIIISEDKSYLERFKDLIETQLFISQSIIDLLIKNRNTDGISRITYREIADFLGMNPQNINKKIKRLEEIDNCIDIISSKEFKVNHDNMLEKGPVSKLIILIKNIDKNEDICKLSYKEQCRITRLSFKELQTAYGYIYNCK